jgi:tRNA-splicing ligase RtcB
MSNKNAMSTLKITGKDLINFGMEPGPAMGKTLDVVRKLYKHSSLEDVKAIVSDVLSNPDLYKKDTHWSGIAELLNPSIVVPIDDEIIELEGEGVECSVYGREGIEKGAFDQIQIASMLPIAVKASLQSDAHAGYGLPIGGVLATDNAIIPYGVGVDIGCRMALTLYELPDSWLSSNTKKLTDSLRKNTFFGKGVSNDQILDNSILDRTEFTEIPILKNLKDKARIQLGTSGSGNHFVSWGVVELVDSQNEFNLPAGKYVGLLTHSGSRGVGAMIAHTYTQIAMDKCKLPDKAKHLAWLDMSSTEGQEYWIAMNFAGDYASACHDEIHKRLAKVMGVQPVAKIENHHNFAWKENLDGKEVIVHRKGATPAGAGVLGIIPGSAIHPGYIVRGKGNSDSINSASHGAGRAMSRTKAKAKFTKRDIKELMIKNGVTMVGGGTDEHPMAYKNIEDVMSSQVDLVEILGTYNTRICRMANE